MALFLDSADPDTIAAALKTGIYSGITTNPYMVSHLDTAARLDLYGNLARLVRGTLFLQAERASTKMMVQRARILFEVAPGRTVIKIPHEEEGLAACRALAAEGIPVCMTAVFTPLQALAGALAGAHSVAVYVGRITRRGEDGPAVVARSAALLSASGSACRVLAASIPDAATLEAVLHNPRVDATLPSALHQQLVAHPGTREALEDFSRLAGKA